jgi:hypothetical protein
MTDNYRKEPAVEQMTNIVRSILKESNIPRGRWELWQDEDDDHPIVRVDVTNDRLPTINYLVRQGMDMERMNHGQGWMQLEYQA